MGHACRSYKQTLCFLHPLVVTTMMKACLLLALTVGVCYADNNSTSHCFPGEAVVGSVPLATYDSAMGFLHALPGPASFLAIQHEGGELRASDNHLLFNGEGLAMAAELLTAGDELLLATGLRSRILSVTKDTTKHGMFAPLTASGTIEVDGVMASNYATVSKLNIPHSAMHASFTLSRMFSSMQATQSTASETVNPLAYVFHSVLKLDKLL